MTTAEVEHPYMCPNCWEKSTLLIDLSESGEQAFIQDCEVCCTPIEFTVMVRDGEVRSFAARSANE